MKTTGRSASPMGLIQGNSERNFHSNIQTAVYLIVSIMSNLKLIRKITTREELMNALATGGKVSIVPSDTHMKLIGCIHSVARRGGGGFNVTMFVNNPDYGRRENLGEMGRYVYQTILKTVYIRFSA